ncbi:MAG: GMP synthase subunit A [Candidatus Micrarchaeia archaeon]
MIAIIDNGGQYTHLIGRCVRELGFEARTFQNKSSFEAVKEADAIILSGGPGSAYKDDFGICERAVMQAFEKGMPLLGICMGHQLIAHYLGGSVGRGENAEYGVVEISVDEERVLFSGVPRRFRAWVSHFDEVKKMPKGFVKTAHSEKCGVEAMEHEKKPIFGVQFHPEVWHTEHGEKIIANFLSLMKK